MRSANDLNTVVPRVLRTCVAHDLRLTCFVVGRDAAIDENVDALAALAAPAVFLFRNPANRNSPLFLRKAAGAAGGCILIRPQALERAGLIKTRRSRITILDRKALEKNCNGTYAPMD
jgi:peptidoglycan/xylan/chitin deacetylase (PgdA/CDA1 family)